MRAAGSGRAPPEKERVFLTALHLTETKGRGRAQRGGQAGAAGRGPTEEPPLEGPDRPLPPGGRLGAHPKQEALHLPVPLTLSFAPTPGLDSCRAQGPQCRKSTPAFSSDRISASGTSKKGILRGGGIQGVRCRMSSGEEKDELIRGRGCGPL